MACWIRLVKTTVPTWMCHQKKYMKYGEIWYDANHDMSLILVISNMIFTILNDIMIPSTISFRVIFINYYRITSTPLYLIRLSIEIFIFSGISRDTNNLPAALNVALEHSSKKTLKKYLHAHVPYNPDLNVKDMHLSYQCDMFMILCFTLYACKYYGLSHDKVR